jgi:hypothetical protein
MDTFRLEILSLYNGDGTFGVRPADTSRFGMSKTGRTMGEAWRRATSIAPQASFPHSRYPGRKQHRESFLPPVRQGHRESLSPAFRRSVRGMLKTTPGVVLGGRLSRGQKGLPVLFLGVCFFGGFPRG